MRLDVPAGIFTHDPPHEEMGIVELGIDISGGKSIATSQYHTRALKIIRPHYLDDTGQVYYTVVNPGGGYVGGDAYRISVDVAPGASCLLTDQSAAKVYRTPGEYVVQNIDLTVGDGAVLEYVPDQLILYRDADFRQQLTARVHENGSLFFSDIITPGWSPDGGRFLYKQARLRNVVYINDELEIVDNLRLNPLDPEFGAEQDFFLGKRTHVANAVCVDPGVTPELIDEIRTLIDEHVAADSTSQLMASLSATDRPGFIIRALGNRTEELFSMVLAVGSLVRGRLRGQGPITLRQY